MPEPSSLQQPETKLIRVPNMKTKTSNFRKRLGAKIQQMVKKKTGAKTRSDKEANHNQREVCEADLETREGARARSTVHVEENEGYCKVCANLSQDVPNLHFPTLKTSAEDGCPCCSTLLRIFEHFVYDGHRLIDAAADQYIDTKSYYSNGHRYAVDIVISSLNALIGLSIAPGNIPTHCYKPN
jgi:hypothetical protein